MSVIREKRMHEQITLCLHIRKIFEKWRARKEPIERAHSAAINAL